MDEQKRTKLLAAVLVGVIAIYGGRSVVSRVFLEPIEKAEQKLKVSGDTFKKLQFEEMQLRAARNNLDSWRASSLPDDSLVAQRLYREWIENLAIRSGFTLQSVEPGAKNEHKGRYLTVSVDVKGETDLAGLSRFLYLFDQTDLLQSVTSLKVNSTGTQGNPRLEIALTAEGASVVSSGTRSDLFPRTTVTKTIGENDQEVQVQSAQAFPKPPVLLQLERELLRVTAVRGDTLTVERGVYGTRPASHSEGAVSELLPFHYERREQQFEQYADLMNGSPFAIPAPPKKWSPRVTGLADTTIKPGEEVRLTAKADDINPELGAPRFTLLESVDGMTLDPVSGVLVWKTAPDQSAGQYRARVAMSQENASEQKVEAQVSVTVKVPNAPPQLTTPDSAIVVLGQPFELAAKATDDGPADQLTYSVSGGPEGLSIDAATGVIRWTPPMTVKPGSYDVEVKVTDRGTEPQSAARKVALNVQDDSAILTILTGAVSKDDVRFAWFRNKGTGEKMELQIGQRLKVSEIDAEIVAIENRAVLLQDDKGTWKLALGNTIRQRVLVQPSEAAAGPASVPASDSATPTSVQTSESGSPESDSGSNEHSTSGHPSSGSAAEDGL